jgi:outer membrane protein TolC
MPRFLVVVAASLLFTIPAHAQRVLSLDDALARGRVANRDLKQARERLGQTLAGIEQARAALLPSVVLQGKYTHNYKEVDFDFSAITGAFTGFGQALNLLGNGVLAAGVQNPPVLQQTLNNINAQLAAGMQSSAFNTTPIVIQRLEQLDLNVSLAVPLIVPHAYPGYSGAKRAHEANIANLKVTEANVLVTVAQTFFAAAGTDELVAARQHAIEVAQKTLDNAKARLEAGVVNKVEVMRAELALVRAQQALKEAADNQAQAYRSLGTLLNIKEPLKVLPPPEGSVVAPTENIGELTQDAMRLRPELLAASKNIEVARLQGQSALWRWAPTLSGFGLVRAFNYPGFSGDNYAWALGLQLDWLIYDGGVRDATRHSYEAQERENRIKLDQARDQLADEVFNSRRALDTKKAALETSQRAVKLSHDTLELVRVQYEAGTATQLDLLLAQDNLVLADVGVAQARFDYMLADLALRKATGAFPGVPKE